MKNLRFMLLLSLLACISGCNDEKKKEVPPVFSTEFLLLTSWNGEVETGGSDFPVIMLFLEEQYGRIKTPEDFVFRDFVFSVKDNRYLSIDVIDYESVVDGVWTLLGSGKEHLLFRRESAGERAIMKLELGTAFRLH